MTPPTGSFGGAERRGEVLVIDFPAGKLGTVHEDDGHPIPELRRRAGERRGGLHVHYLQGGASPVDHGPDLLEDPGAGPAASPGEEGDHVPAGGVIRARPGGGMGLRGFSAA